MTGITIKYDEQQMLAQIADSAAYRIVENLRHELERETRSRVSKLIDDQINAIVTETLEKQFQPADAFGDPVGDPTSIKAIIAAKAKAFMEETVDVNGRACKDHYSAKQPRAQFLLGQMVGEAITSGVKREVEAIAKQAKEQAHLKIAKLVVDTIAKS